MDLVLIQGVVMVKAYYDAIDNNYSVKEKIVYKGRFKWQKELVIFKDLIFSKLEFSPNNFNEKNRYYDATDKLVMYNPHCDLFLANQSRQSKFFNTKEELNLFIDFIKENNITISI